SGSRLATCGLVRSGRVVGAVVARAQVADEPRPRTIRRQVRRQLALRALRTEGVLAGGAAGPGRERLVDGHDHVHAVLVRGAYLTVEPAEVGRARRRGRQVVPRTVATRRDVGLLEVEPGDPEFDPGRL